MSTQVWPSKTKCQVCNKLPKVLGVNSRPGELVICEPCDRRNNPYWYLTPAEQTASDLVEADRYLADDEIPPPIPTEDKYQTLTFEMLGL